jgi:integrase
VVEGQDRRQAGQALVHSDILTALASEPDWTGKTRNNKASVLRMALQLAVRDGVIPANPIDGLEAARTSARAGPVRPGRGRGDHRRPGQHYDEQVARYFGRSSSPACAPVESLAQRWDWIDWRQNTMGVAEAVVLGEHKDRTKTNTVRHVQLNSRALGFLRTRRRPRSCSRTA